MKWETVGNDIPRILMRTDTLQYEAGRDFEEPVTLLWSLWVEVTRTIQLDIALQRGSGYKIYERW